MKFSVSRATLPQTIFPILPFVLFFPSGFRNTGVLLFLIALLAAGNYAEKWRNMRQSPLFWPVVAMLGVSVVAGILLDSSARRFGSAFAHYQIYLFLLFFLCIGAGEWQRKAARAFAVGALVAASLFYLKALGLLPDVELFQNYMHYAGNNSILLALMLALASGVFLYEAVLDDHDRRWRLRSLAAFLYVTPAVLLYGESRTATLMCVLLCAVALFQAAVQSWRRALALLGLFALLLVIAWEFSPSLRARVDQTVQAVESAMRGQGANEGRRDARVELYGITSDIIAEKPLTGHGIGQWVELYAERAKGLPTGHMITPHNDYLLYLAEMGVAGVAALLAIWLTQFVVAIRIRGRQGMYLGMLTITLVVGALFNAILRDAVFGMPLMILLAIPLAGVKWPLQRTAPGAVGAFDSRAAA